ncbi:MAG: sensor histidine kinase [Actinomycetales bacterium]|nr:sensor histidine kinase [Actinomycetales bacterium]
MRWWDRLTAWDRAHPVAADAAMVLATLLVTVVLGATTYNPSGLWWAVAFTTPLAVRRLWPVASAVTVFTVGLVQLVFWVLELNTGAGAVPNLGHAMVLVSMYSVTMFGPRWAYRTAAVGSLVGAAVLGASVTATTDDLRAGLIATAVVGLSAMTAFAFGLVRRSRREQVDALHERARRLEAERDQQTAAAAAAERARIAREMHDIVAHSLSVVIAQADGGRYAGATDPEAAVRSLGTIAETGRAALTDMRRLLGVLRTDADPPGHRDGPDTPLRPQPAADQIAELVEQVRDSGLEVSLVRMGTPRTLPPGTGLAVYRICQESLTNVLKHAGPQARATVLLQWGATSLVLEVSDDGRGAAAADDGAGQGSIGMRERATMLGGTLTLGPRPGGGFRVRAEIPIPPAPQEDR